MGRGDGRPAQRRPHRHRGRPRQRPALHREQQNHPEIGLARGAAPLPRPHRGAMPRDHPDMDQERGARQRRLPGPHRAQNPQMPPCHRREKALMRSPPLASFEWRSSGSDQPPPPLQNPYPWGSSGTATPPPPSEWRASGGNRTRARVSQSTRFAPLRHCALPASRGTEPQSRTLITHQRPRPSMPFMNTTRRNTPQPSLRGPHRDGAPADIPATHRTDKPGNADITPVTSGGNSGFEACSVPAVDLGLLGRESFHARPLTSSTTLVSKTRARPSRGVYPLSSMTW